jgi:hypothetical protein
LEDERDTVGVLEGVLDSEGAARLVHFVPGMVHAMGSTVGSPHGEA